MPVAVVGDLFIHLVRHDQQVAPPGDVRQGLEFFVREHPPGRVGRIDQGYHPGVGRHSPFDGRCVDAKPVCLIQRNRHHLAAGQFDFIYMLGIVRLQHDDFIPGVNRRHADGKGGMGHAAADENLIGARFDVVSFKHLLRQRLAELLQTAKIAVMDLPVIQGLFGGFLDMRRRIETGHADLEVYDIDTLLHHRYCLFIHAEGFGRRFSYPFCRPFHLNVSTLVFK